MITKVNLNNIHGIFQKYPNSKEESEKMGNRKKKNDPQALDTDFAHMVELMQHHNQVVSLPDWTFTTFAHGGRVAT